MMQKPGTWSTFENTCFFIKVFCSAFKTQNHIFAQKPLSVNLSGSESGAIYTLLLK